MTRMQVRLFSIPAGLGALLLAGGCAVRADRQDPSPEALLSWTVEVSLTVVAPDAPPFFHVGSEDRLRVVYDPRSIDPKTGTVRIIGVQHFLEGHWSEPAGQPGSDQSVLNVRERSIDYQRAVTHGTPILIALTPARWSAVYSHVDGHQIVGGPYVLEAAGPVTCNAASWRSKGDC